MKFELISPDDPSLRMPSRRYDFDDPTPLPPFEFAEALEEAMNRLGGLGLSAVQVGYRVRVFCMKTEPDVTMFNPSIVDSGEETIELEEGCLSYPGLVMGISRPKVIKVRFTLKDGDVRTMKLSGMTARIFQHELDHLDGKRFFDGQSRLKTEMAIRRAKKAGHRYSWSDLHGNKLGAA